MIRWIVGLLSSALFPGRVLYRSVHLANIVDKTIFFSTMRSRPEIHFEVTDSLFFGFSSWEWSIPNVLPSVPNLKAIGEVALLGMPVAQS